MSKYRKKKTLSLILIVTFILNIFSAFLGEIVKAEDGSKFLQKIVDKSEVYPGEEFTYTIKYTNPNTTEDANNVKIIDDLPSNIKYISSTPSVDIQETKVENVGGRDRITFIFKDPLKAGVSGILKIKAKFPEGVTLPTIDGNPNIAENTASMEGDNITTVTSNKVTVTPKVKDPDWDITKTRIVPSAITPAVGFPVTYEINITGNSAIGGLDLKDVIVVDTIPAGAEYISSSNGGLYSEGKVTWNIGNLSAGSSQRRTVTIMYPSNNFNKSDSVKNTADVYGKLFGSDSELTKNAEVTHGFTDPNIAVGNFSKNGRQGDDRYSIGQTAKFGINGIENTGNVPLDKIEIIDTIPDKIKLTNISTGNYNNSANIEVQYEIDKSGTWTIWPGTPVDSTANQSLNASDITLALGEKITGVKWIITNGVDGIAAGFKNTSSINVEGTFIDVVVGDKITNNANLTASRTGSPDIIKNVSKEISIIAPMPWLVSDKTVKNGQFTFNMNEEVEYNIRVKNHDFATGDYVNPIVVDVLPVELEDVTIIGWNKGNSSIVNEPVVDTSGTSIIDSKTHQLLRWDFTGNLAPGEYIDVKYKAKIKDKTLVGKVSNKAYITTNVQSVFENPVGDLITDTNKLNKGSNFANSMISSTNDIFVNFVGSIDAQKWVKGELDADWGYYSVDDGYGKTLPGGIADYRLKIKNSGANGPISNLVLIDILPYVGDSGVIDTKARETEWRPYLVNKMTGENGGVIPAGMKVYYSTNPNPSKSELSDPIANKGLPSDSWAETPPEDITTVRSIKVDFGDIVLQPDEEVILEWPMRAPFEAPRNKIAWNSFGYGATYPDVNGQEPFLPSEPKKVGFYVEDDPTPQNYYYIGDFVWEDMDKNGIQDDGDTGINGVLVNLYRTGDITPYKYTRTGDNHLTGKPGYYEFPNLTPGSYWAEFVYPKNYKIAPYNSGTDDSLDSDIDNSNPLDYPDGGTVKYSKKTEEIVIVDKNNFSIDAGLYRLASLGDKVWHDKNANGRQDSGENGIAGVTVSLLDTDDNQAKYGDNTLVPDATTDVNGNYKFENLEPGIYKVKFTNPGGDYKFTSLHAGSNNDKDSDAASLDGVTATTDPIQLKSGENNMSVDVGMYLAQIGDFVWHDKNANGIQEAGEGGIAGVTVKLTDKDGNTVKDIYGNDISTKVTDSQGKYLFIDLKPGEYKVEFTKPGIYEKFTKRYSTIIDEDSNADRGAGISDVVVLAPGERDLTIDAGLYNLASLGDFVWRDKNANGIQDAGEAGISGITVKLLDKDENPAKYEDGSLVLDSTTDVNGNYKFENLEPGTYKVRFVNADDSYKFSTPSQGGDTAKDSNGIVSGDELVAVSSQVTLSSGENNTTIDAGLHKALIGEFVWHDLDGDGIQDVGEAGIVGVKVELLDKDENPIKDSGNNPITTLTDSKGRYEFNDLDAGEYRIKFNLPNGYSFSLEKNTSTTTDKDSNSNNVSGVTEVITLAKGQVDKSWDSGMYVPAELGDFVWLDKNGNGIQDVGEEAIQGVTVKLLDSTRNPIKDTDGKDRIATTDIDGKYSFTNLVPGAYKVKFENSTYYKLTSKTQGSNASIDSDADTTTGEVDVVLQSGDKNSTIDAGYIINSKIILQKTVYVGHDGGNGTGIENVQGEKGTSITYLFTITNTGTTYLKNIELNDVPLGIDKSKMTKLSGNDLLEPNGKLIYYYESSIISDLENKATVKGSPSDNLGAGIPNGEDVTAEDTSNVKELKPGIEIQKTVYSGHYIGGQTGGELVVGEKGTPITYIFKVKNTGNIYLKDILIDDATLKVDKSKMLKISGSEPLEPGKELIYYYETVIDGDLTNIVKAEGTPSDSLDNVITTASKPSAQDTATVDEVKPLIEVDKTVYNGQYNAGKTGSELAAGKIGSYVTYVFTIKNTGDTHLKDITISDGVLGINKADMTKISGDEPLAPGVSIIYYYDNAKISGDLINTVTVEGVPCDNSGNNVPNTTNPSTSDTAQVKVSASLGDYIWNDTNVNGIQEGSEKGIPNVKVILKDDKGSTITALTDGDGKYLFDDLIPGNYTVSVDLSTLPAGMVKRYELDSNLDNKVNITLESGENKKDVDFGYYKPTSRAPIIQLSSVGDYIWIDDNSDGKQDMKEKGLSNIKVILTNQSGNQLEMYTDQNGKYSFKDLVPGDYTISVDKSTLPENIKETYELDTSLDNKVRVTLSSGQNKMDVDFGYNILKPVEEKTTTIEAYVWHDENGNKKKDTEEKGIENVKVVLIDSEGNRIIAITDKDGKYTFTGLKEESYKISIEKETIPEDLEEKTYEADDIFDNVVSIDLSEGEVNEEINFGYNKRSSGIQEKETPEDPTEPDKNNENDDTTKNIEDISQKDKDNDYKLEENYLPKTGSGDFNLLFLGILSFMFSGLFILNRKFKRNLK